MVTRLSAVDKIVDSVNNFCKGSVFCKLLLTLDYGHNGEISSEQVFGRLFVTEYSPMDYAGFPAEFFALTQSGCCDIILWRSSLTL